jgi:hypothetical protein
VVTPGCTNGLDHVEHAGGQAPGGAHFLLFLKGFDGHVHGAGVALFPAGVHGIKRGYF